MATVYGAYLSPLARDIQVVMLESEASWKRIEAMEYIMEASTQSAYLEAERDVLRRGGFVDDFESAYLMIESENEEKSDGLLVSIAKAISGMLKGLVDALTGAFKSGEIKKACNENTEIELSEKKAGVLQKLPGIWTGAKAILSGVFDKLFKNEDGNFDPASTIRTGIIAAAGLGIWAKGKGENTKVEDEGKTKIYKGNVVENMISGLRSTLEDIEKFFDDVSLKYQQSVGKNALSRKMKEAETNKDKDKDKKSEGSNEGAATNESVGADGRFFAEAALFSTVDKTNVGNAAMQLLNAAKNTAAYDGKLDAIGELETQLEKVETTYNGLSDAEKKTLPNVPSQISQTKTAIDSLKNSTATRRARGMANYQRSSAENAYNAAQREDKSRAHQAAHRSAQDAVDASGNHIQNQHQTAQYSNLDTFADDIEKVKTNVENIVKKIQAEKTDVKKRLLFNKEKENLNAEKTSLGEISKKVNASKMNGRQKRMVLEEIQKVYKLANNAIVSKGTTTEPQQTPQTPEQTPQQQTPQTPQQPTQPTQVDRTKMSKADILAAAKQLSNQVTRTENNKTMSQKAKNKKYDELAKKFDVLGNTDGNTVLSDADKEFIKKDIEQRKSVINSLRTADQPQPQSSEQPGTGSQAPEGGQQPSESGSNGQNANPDKPAESEANNEEESDEKSGGDKEDTRSSKEKAIDQKSLNEKLKPSVMDKIKGAWDAFKETISLIATGLADVISKVPGLGGVVDRIRGKKLEGDDKKDDKAEGKDDDKVPDDNGENGAAQAEPQAAEGQEGTENASANPILQGLFGINDSDLEVINESYDEDLETLDALFSMI